MTFITTPFVRSFVGFDNLFDELEKVSNFKEGSFPAYNIEKTDERSYEITLALAGFCKDQLKIEVEQNVLTVSSVGDNLDNKKEYIHKGIATRAFKKQFRLAEHVEIKSATLENGILSLCLVKNVPEAELKKQIEILVNPRTISSKVA